MGNFEFFTATLGVQKLKFPLPWIQFTIFASAQYGWKEATVKAIGATDEVLAQDWA